jgi:hypothetical protein
MMLRGNRHGVHTASGLPGVLSVETSHVDNKRAYVAPAWYRPRLLGAGEEQLDLNRCARAGARSVTHAGAEQSHASHLGIL